MKKNQKIIITAVVILLVIVGGIFFLNNYLKNEITKGLENEYSSSALSYDDISINVLAGNAVIRNLRIKEGTFSLETSEVSLKDFSYSDYLKNEDIIIGSVHLLDPEIVINKSDSSSGSSQQNEMGNREIRVDNFTVSGGNLRIIENDSASNTLYASLQNIRVGDVVINKKAENTPLPFDYGSIELKSDSLYYNMNANNYLQVNSLSLDNKDLSLNGLSIVPKFPKEEFDQRIPYEQDWIALKVDVINFQGVEWKKEEEKPVIMIPSTKIENANLQIYRNKMLKDDTSIKPMYSEMLRELDLKLQLDSVNISGSYIEYEEKVLENRPVGKLSFQNVKAEIKNITNLNLDSAEFPKTMVEASALFMGESNLTLNLEFDVSNELDQFQVNGMLGSIRADQINSFLVPTMNVEAEGEIESLYYNFYGNRNVAKGDMQLSYRNFKVNILKDGEDGKKSFLSGLANLIIKNDQINEDVEQENISVNRDKTKSFWNFLWLSIRDGALSTFF